MALFAGEVHRSEVAHDLADDHLLGRPHRPARSLPTTKRMAEQPPAQTFTETAPGKVRAKAWAISGDCGVGYGRSARPGHRLQMRGWRDLNRPAELDQTLAEPLGRSGRTGLIHQQDRRASELGGRLGLNLGSKMSPEPCPPSAAKTSAGAGLETAAGLSAAPGSLGDLGPAPPGRRPTLDGTGTDGGDHLGPARRRRTAPARSLRPERGRLATMITGAGPEGDRDDHHRRSGHQAALRLRQLCPGHAEAKASVERSCDRPWRRSE